MMVEAQCPACGRNVKRPATEFVLWLCMSRPDRNFYTFTCPACGTPVAKRCDRVVEKLLSRVGVRRRPYRLPLEIDDPQRANPLPLSPDDHLDLLNEIAAWDAA